MITSVFDVEAFANVSMPPAKAEARRPFWCKAPPVIVDGTLTNGGMFLKQRAFWELDNFVKLFVGGYGSGKTYIGAKRIITDALDNAPCPVAVVSPSFRVARHTVVSTLTSLLAGKRTNYGRRFWFKFNKSLHEFHFRYHGREATIIVYSGEDPASLIGPNLAAAWIDEPFVQDVAVFRQMLARVRHPEATRREIILTGTPEQLNWGYGLATKDDDFKNVDVGVIHASTRENLAYGGGWYVDQLLGGFDGRAADAYIEGKFVNLSAGQVYHAFDHTRNVATIPAPPNAEWGAGMDFNVNPMAFVVFWRSGPHIHVVKEFELPNSDTEYACQILREQFVANRPEHQRLVEVYPDPAGLQRHTNAPGGKSDFWFIEAGGFEVNAHKAHPRRRDRYNSVNARLKPAMVVQGRPQPPMLTIEPSCRKLIKYLAVYTHENMNKDSQKAMSHLLDAFSYPIEYLFPAPTPMDQVERLLGA